MPLKVCVFCEVFSTDGQQNQLHSRQKVSSSLNKSAFLLIAVMFCFQSCLDLILHCVEARFCQVKGKKDSHVDRMEVHVVSPEFDSP